VLQRAIDDLTEGVTRTKLLLYANIVLASPWWAACFGSGRAAF
jgi:hypothetical protein